MNGTEHHWLDTLTSPDVVGKLLLSLALVVGVVVTRRIVLGIVRRRSTNVVVPSTSATGCRSGSMRGT